METQKTNTKKVGLALGSGGFRGPAHIGVLKALIDNNIPINYLSGCSIGAWIAAHYAVHTDLDALANLFLENQKAKLSFLFDITLKKGILSGDSIEKFLTKNLKNADFSETTIPLKLVTTDIVEGKKFVLSEGSLAKAVRASISIPGAFKPINFKGKILTDGAITSPLPVAELKEMGAELTIACNLYNHYVRNNSQLKTGNVILRNTEILLYNFSLATEPKPDIMLNPDTSRFYRISMLKKFWDKNIIKEMIKIGEEETLSQIKKIKQLLIV